MTSRRKELEREIARTEDPVIRMQLRNLLKKKEQRQGKIIRRIEETLDSSMRQELGRLPAGAPLVLILIALAIIMLVIFLIMESGL